MWSFQSLSGKYRLLAAFSTIAEAPTSSVVLARLSKMSPVFTLCEACGVYDSGSGLISESSKNPVVTALIFKMQF